MKYCALALIAKGPVHGLELTTRFGTMGGPTVSPGTVYPLLSRLRREGLVSSTWEATSVGPPRRVYGITPRGMEESMDFAQVWPAVCASVSEIVSGK